MIQSPTMRYASIGSRRRFLQFLAGSPLALGANDAPDAAITDPMQALSVLDLEPAAKQALPPAHYGYMASGVDGDVTVKANCEAFSRVKLRPRRMVDVRTVDTTIELFGVKWNSPVALAPCGSQKAFHAEGEVAAARAAKSRRALQLLSTMTSSPVEEVAEAAGGSIWYQLYPTSRWDAMEKIVHRVEQAGCPVLVLTVDRVAPRNSETQARFRRLDSRKCDSCHNPGAGLKRKPMFRGIDTEGLSLLNPALDWKSVAQLKKLTSMKLVLKGLETAEDAKLAVESGADGIVVSNHGGRAEEGGRATIESLPEVIDAVRGRIPVLLDGGVRRGTDVFKALAIGASAVCIGRPYLWGLSAFGQAGVERSLDLLRLELELIMKQCGTTTIAGISRAAVELPRLG